MTKDTIKIKLISSLEKVLLNKEPQFVEDCGSMLKNQRYHFQLALTAVDNAPFNIRHGYSIRVDSEISDAITLRYVEHMPSIMPVDLVCDDYSIGIDAGLYPDLLIPFENRKHSVIAGRWFSVWVTIDGNKVLKAGKYPIRFTVLDWDYNPSEAEYTLEVLPSRLPKLRIPVTNWVHCDCIANYHNVDAFSDEFYDIYSRYLDRYVEHGSNTLLLPIFTPPLDTHEGYERRTTQAVKIRLVNNRFGFDFGELDKLINLAKKKGIEYFEICHLFSQWGAKKCPKIEVEVDGVNQKLFGWHTDADSTEYFELLSKLLPKLRDCLIKHGIYKKTFFHLSDEPNKDCLEHYKKLRNFVKSVLPDCTIIEALTDHDFVAQGLIDMPVVPTYRSQPFLDNHTPHWVYYTHYQRKYYSNRLISLPSERTRVLGLQLYLNNALGYLHWGYNFYNCWLSVFEVDPLHTTDSELANPSGNAFVVYPDKKGKGAFDSLRHELLCDALQDYRLCCLVEQKYGREYVLKLLQNEGMIGYNVYEHSPKWLKEVVTKLQNLTNT